MSEMIEKTLRHLRNTRELRAEILDIAATLAVNKKQSAHLIVAFAGEARCQHRTGRNAFAV